MPFADALKNSNTNMARGGLVYVRQLFLIAKDIAVAGHSNANQVASILSGRVARENAANRRTLPVPMRGILEGINIASHKVIHIKVWISF